ncbi:MAG: hypothetical protein NT049_07190, partial [Planctomycetota bacterium]|nr:hypothetical protein [Planctomycetota bacterium]
MDLHPTFVRAAATADGIPGRPCGRLRRRLLDAPGFGPDIGFLGLLHHAHTTGTQQRQRAADGAAVEVDAAAGDPQAARKARCRKFERHDFIGGHASFGTDDPVTRGQVDLPLEVGQGHLDGRFLASAVQQK